MKAVSNTNLSMILCSFQLLPILLLLLNISYAKVCLPVEDDTYFCTDDPSKLRDAAMTHDAHNSPLSKYYSSDGTILDSVFGETQRLDGTEQEIEAVKVILQQMYQYFENEVLVLSEYKTVRDIWYAFHFFT
jgi:hypothetical protein